MVKCAYCDDEGVTCDASLLRTCQKHRSDRYDPTEYQRGLAAGRAEMTARVEILEKVCAKVWHYTNLVGLDGDQAWDIDHLLYRVNNPRSDEPLEQLLSTIQKESCIECGDHDPKVAQVKEKPHPAGHVSIWAIHAEQCPAGKLIEGGLSREEAKKKLTRWKEQNWSSGWVYEIRS